MFNNKTRLAVIKKGCTRTNLFPGMYATVEKNGKHAHVLVKTTKLFHYITI